MSKLDMTKLEAISKKDVYSSPEQAFAKITEEMGEFAAAFLVHTNSPNKSKTAEDNPLEEGVDTAMCIFDVLYKLGYTTEQINETLQTKLDKWDSKLKERGAK